MSSAAALNRRTACCVSTTSRPATRQRRKGSGRSPVSKMSVSNHGWEPSRPIASRTPSRALDQEWQIEGKNVVVLEHVRISGVNQLDEALDEPSLAQRAGIQRLVPAAA